MTEQEKRQAARIVRNAKAVEHLLFGMIAELQDGMRSEGEHFEWESINDNLRQVQDGLPLLFDLVRNIQREVPHT